MGASLLALDSLSERDVEAWRDLARRSLQPNPFFEPEFAVPAGRLLDSRGVSLLVAGSGGDWLACLPLKRYGRGPLSLLASWKHIYCFLGTPLIDRERAGEASRALLESGSPLVLRLAADEGVLERLGEAGAENGFVRLHETVVERAALVRARDDDYLADLRPHRRREHARLRRRLGEELGASLEVVDLAGEAAAVESFLELEGAGWKGQEGTAFASDPSHAEFFREICRTYADQGRLQLLALKADERTVAMKCNLIAGDELFCFKIAHDERLAAFSPGVLLELDNMTIFHNGRSERMMDSCADHDNEMINRLWRDRRRIATVALGRRGPSGRLLGRALRLYAHRQPDRRNPT